MRSGEVLRSGDPVAARLDPTYLSRLVATAYLSPTPDHPGHPAYAGAVILAARNGIIALSAAVGSANRYTVQDGHLVDLPLGQRTAMSEDTLFDIASLTKLFTTVVVMLEVQRHTVDLDAPVVRYLPEFGANDKATITVRQLLTHTAGLAEDINLTSYPNPSSALAAVLTAPLENGLRPGAQFHYSDLGMITLGALVERITGQRLDRLVASEITKPLGMTDTSFSPTTLPSTGFSPPPGLRDRIAATEYRPGRGILRGEAHDEKVAPLGGIAGHAGIFSTARDLAVFAQMLLDSGSYGRTRILERGTVTAMLTNQNGRFPGDDHGLGIELNQSWYMGRLASPTSFGHTGFTGTSLVVDPVSGTILVLLSNAVHPDRYWNTKTPYRNVARRTLADDLAGALRSG